MTIITNTNNMNTYHSKIEDNFQELSRTLLNNTQTLCSVT